MKKLLIILLVIFVFMLIAACKKVTQTEYNIDKKSCNSCGICVTKCKSDAIEFDENGKATIDLTKCTQCGECVRICPQNAIY
ncbi:MAG: 4Fe-4S binding protein [Candidatus Cloacimonetes bacterium]|jgi:ferredoxin|nr:4Fe-4S binding protein [Candidatus Cloacimonadota bacterium]